MVKKAIKKKKAVKKKKKKEVPPGLKTWVGLNAVLLKADEATCKGLLKIEKAGRKRKMFLLRIHSRLNRVRRAAEREKF